jgi:predicted AAA+ superfamily ATPase
MRYVPRTLKPPKESFFLFGPRGAGKSTWIKHAFKDAYRIDLLDAELERIYSARPERLREEIKMLEQGSFCCIDEVQKIPELLSVVHALIEERCGIQFILTGSSARKLRRTVQNLLGGRALLRQMGPFLASELKSQFSLKKALKTGLVPIIWESLEPLEKLRTYVSLYLKEEVQAEGLVRQVGDFARFMEVMSFSQGCLVNTSQIARESLVKRSTVDNYLQILDDLFLSFTIHLFTRRAKRALVAHPKFYYFDVGVYRYLRPKGPLDQEAELEGPALEGLVAQHLRSWVLSQMENHQLSFWRTQTGLEVDFVVYGPRGFWAIEVKRKAELSPSDIRGLTAFQEEYPEASCFIVHGGSRRTIYRGFLCIPMEEFLLSIDPDEPLQNGSV